MHLASQNLSSLTFSLFNLKYLFTFIAFSCFTNRNWNRQTRIGKWLSIYVTATFKTARLHPKRDPLPAGSVCRAKTRQIRRHRAENPARQNIALIFEKSSTRTRCAFEVAAFDQGAQVSYIGPSGSQIGHKESMKDTARVLGRMYDGIQYRGFGQEIVEVLGQYAGCQCGMA